MATGRLAMVIACNHYRFNGATAERRGQFIHACKLLGECKPILDGPDVSRCPYFRPNAGGLAGGTPEQGRAVRPVTTPRATAEDDDMTEYCPCTGKGV